jgi:hypothetical protein
VADDPQVQDVDREAADLDALYDEPCPCGKETCALNCDACLRAFLKRIREQAIDAAITARDVWWTERVRLEVEQAIEECCKAVCSECKTSTQAQPCSRHPRSFSVFATGWCPGWCHIHAGGDHSVCSAGGIRKGIARTKEGA